MGIISEEQDYYKEYMKYDVTCLMHSQCPVGMVMTSTEPDDSWAPLSASLPSSGLGGTRDSQTEDLDENIVQNCTI